MKFLKVLIQCILSYFLGVLACVVFGLTAVSYYSVEQLIEATSPEKEVPSESKGLVKADTANNLKNDTTKMNPNIKELTLIGLKYAAELNLFDKFAEQINKNAQSNNICETLCNPIFMDQTRLSEEQSAYLLSYYRQAGIRAFSDPLFRLRLKELDFISTLYPSPLRSFVLNISSRTSEPLTTTDKLILALKLETITIKEAITLYTKRHQLIQNAEHLKSLRHLLRSCQKGPPKGKILADCQKVPVSFFWQ